MAKRRSITKRGSKRRSKRLRRRSVKRSAAKRLRFGNSELLTEFKDILDIPNDELNTVGKLIDLSKIREIIQIMKNEKLMDKLEPKELEKNKIILMTLKKLSDYYKGKSDKKNENKASKFHEDVIKSLTPPPPPKVEPPKKEPPKKEPPKEKANNELPKLEIPTEEMKYIEELTKEHKLTPEEREKLIEKVRDYYRDPSKIILFSLNDKGSVVPSLYEKMSNKELEKKQKETEKNSPETIELKKILADKPATLQSLRQSLSNLRKSLPGIPGIPGISSEDKYDKIKEGTTKDDEYV